MHRRCDYPNAAWLLLRYYDPLLMAFLIENGFLWVHTPMSPTVGRDCHLQLFPMCKCHHLLRKSKFPCSSPSLLLPSVFTGIIKQIFASDLLKANLRSFCLQSARSEGGMAAIPGSGNSLAGSHGNGAFAGIRAQQAAGGSTQMTSAKSGKKSMQHRKKTPASG